MVFPMAIALRQDRRNGDTERTRVTDAGPSHHTLSARLRTVYSVATAGLTALGLFWFVTLLIMNLWPLAALEGVMVVVCVLTWLLIRGGRTSMALVLSQLTFYLIILAICLVYDVPNAAAPRVTHLFLLSIALLGYISYVRQPSRLQLGMIGIALASFVVFASTSFVLPLADPLPDAMRIPGSWINTIAALAIIGGSVYIMHAQF